MAGPEDVLVLSEDGNGIVMRHDVLRPATAKAAGRSTTKLAIRLSEGEKRNRKRMAIVGVVHDATPAVRPCRVRLSGEQAIGSVSVVVIDGSMQTRILTVSWWGSDVVRAYLRLMED